VAPRLLRLAAVKLPPQIPVAVFLTSFHPGGTERQMTELVRRLNRHRFDVHVACFHREGAWLRLVDGCAPISEFPIRGFGRPDTLPHLGGFVRWCRARRIAVVQTCDLYANAFALPGAALAGVPVRIGSRRELNPDKSGAQLLLQRLAYRCAHRVVANSTAAARQLESEGMARTRIAIIRNGVTLNCSSRREPGQTIRRIITVANLRREKAHDTLLDAAASLVRMHPELTFSIVGDGPLRADLERRASNLGLDAHVTFLGHREDVPALLAQSDLFVLPSRSEAFPNAVIEAMAAGLPVVARAVGGLLDLVDNGRTGVLVEGDTPAAFHQAIDDLVRAPERAATLGATARDVVASQYSFDRMVAAFEDLYITQLGAARYEPAVLQQARVG
jgi:glycosyltransferase involved in cell wall biosynthesis